MEGETKTFHNKEKLKEYITTKSALQNIFKEILYREEVDKCNQENIANKKSH
jgi:hypothetical protein